MGFVVLPPEQLQWPWTIPGWLCVVEAAAPNALQSCSQECRFWVPNWSNATQPVCLPVPGTDT